MRIIKIEKRVYEYSELQVHAKDIVRNYILSVLHDSDTFSKTIKESIKFLGFKDVELYYSLGNCQGDGWMSIVEYHADLQVLLIGLILIELLKFAIKLIN